MNRLVSQPGRHAWRLLRSAPMWSLTAVALFGLALSACSQAPESAEPQKRSAAQAAQPAQSETAGKPPQFQVANQDGSLIPVEQALVPGKVTVIDFYADWCAPCKALEKQLAIKIDGEHRIAVRKIDVGEADVADILDSYGVRNLPHVRIYGPNGSLLHDLPGTEAERTPELALEAVTAL